MTLRKRPLISERLSYLHCAKICVHFFNAPHHKRQPDALHRRGPGKLPPQFSISEFRPTLCQHDAVPKTLTRDQLQSRKEKAVRFTRDVLSDPDRADEIADESLDDYAGRRKIQITNPTIRRTAIMPRGKTKAELEAEIEELQEENQELQDQLDAVADIVSPDDGDEDEDETGDDDQDDNEDDAQD